ncbi:hypothetical protein [Bacillus sp. FJAT-26390]|uniref:hypothetical protein n=1 Tax=Bacillus sp. FJAT-26390 TaxID=1743142 RepID=UPI0008080445|nr:hypothetical protein [Bacillus sp. FJAT-26390]OBZ13492.1 hypothetical protein A7975_11725 [Bacillus sp. FJAT-26390]
MTFTARQVEIAKKIAIAAWNQPLLSSGLWFHNDIRDNFYYASYLFAAAVGMPEQMPFEAEPAKQTAERVLLEVLQLQDQNTESATYGHWPLNLGQEPRHAKPNVLPVELMGSLMAFFTDRYRAHFSENVAHAFETALVHIYRSGFYRHKNVYGHHDAKYTAAKLIFGQLYGDAELLEDGRTNLQLTLAHVRKHGMSEYGSLPWFWHWVQAFTCAWLLIHDSAIKKELGGMLDYLWSERAAFYLKGTWAGAHCRGQKHDIPLDGNVLHDYVQFGDFVLPAELPRTEYAGLLYYKAPETARQTALHRDEPVEVKKQLAKLSDDGAKSLHSYAYITSDFAAGGMWERYEEFDNEQHRWDITFPIGEVSGVNQAYFFHPAEQNAKDDPRHQSRHTEVLFHKNTIAALYPLPADAVNKIVGVLPNTDWLQEPGFMLGQTNNVYVAVYLMQPYEVDKLADRYVVTSDGGRNGVIIEAIRKQEARQRGISSFEAFAAEARLHAPAWSSDEKLSVRYATLEQNELKLSIGGQGSIVKSVNGLPIDFSEYAL